MDNSTSKKVDNRDHFKSRLGFILAAAGSAVGLGNLWRFPYQVGSNGGGAFVFVYLIFILFIGVSVAITEMVIGRHGKSNVIECYGKYNSKFKIVGWFGMIASLFLYSYYAIVGGWTVFYIVKAISGQLIGLSTGSLGTLLDTFFHSPLQLMIYQIIFLIINAFIISRGISGGIEKYCKVLMPVLFIMLIIMAVRSITLPGAMKGIEWYLKPNFSKINSTVIVSAIGQAFFTLSLGVGSMVTYSSYLKSKENIPKTSISVAIFDTLVALLAGFVVLPAVFAFNLEPTTGPSLVFVTLPHVFSQIPFGTVFAIIFFVLLLIAAVTSSISMLEISTTFVVEKAKISRKKATWLLTLLIFIIGIPPLMSFGSWGHIQLAGKNFYDLYDYFVSNITMPLVGLFGTILVGHIWKKEIVMNELTSNGTVDFKFKNVWYTLIKYVIPIVLFLISLQSLGILKI